MSAAPGSRIAAASAPESSFRHRAVFYRDLDEMVAAVVPFVREGLERGEPVLVAQPADRIRRLEEELGADAARVEFADIVDLGRNPARIIPEWRRFVDEHGAPERARGVGEPVWAGRSAAELAECRLHEALLNHAFDRGQAWQLMCPYDAASLPEEVLADAVRTHPEVTPDGWGGGYAGPRHALQVFAGSLPPAPPQAEEVPFGADDLAGLRSVVRRLCAITTLGPDAVEDLVLASHELATNSVLHGGDGGVLRAWPEPGAMVLEISDGGVIADPMVGRELDTALSEHGRGLWMANQLCDLVQVRSSEAGTVIRLHAWL